MEEFENKLAELFNNTLLPFEAKRYVVIKFFRDVEDAYQNAKKQAQQKQEEQKEGE